MITITGIHKDGSKFEKIILEIKLKLAVEQKQIWSISIKQGIENKVNHDVIIDTLKSQIIDNYNIVADVLGVELTDKILSNE